MARHETTSPGARGQDLICCDGTIASVYPPPGRDRTAVGVCAAFHHLTSERPTWWSARGAATDTVGSCSAVRVRRPDECRAHRRGSRSCRQARGLLRRGCVRRRVEILRWRRDLEADVRQSDVAGHRRARSLPVEPGHCLGGDRRGVGDSRHGHDGGRHLQVGGRR